MITYLGSYTLGGLFPTMLSAVVGVVPRLQAQLAGLLRLSGAIAVTMPSVGARVQAVARVAAALAVTPPGVRLNLNAQVSLIAELKARIAALLALKAAFGSAGVDVFLYEGSAGAMGGEVTNATSGGLPGGVASDTVHAFVVATRYPSTFSAMGKVFLA
jgi:hypothetical protein